jgi:hypothetical protein
VDFSKAQFEALITDISAGMEDFADRLDQIMPAATAAVDHWYVTDAARDAVLWLARESVEIGRELLELFADILRGAVAPVFMFYDAWRWMDVRAAATGAATVLTGQNLTIDDSDWSGRARDAYVDAAGAQSQACTRVGAIANTTSVILLACAAAGSAFYATLAVVLVKLIAAAVTAVAALGSAVFSWAGAALLAEEAGINTAIIGAALSTLTAFLTAQATAMVMLHGEAVDPASFPGGAWPGPDTSGYGDATVADGDADWSLRAQR